MKLTLFVLGWAIGLAGMLRLVYGAYLNWINGGESGPHIIVAALIALISAIFWSAAKQEAKYLDTGTYDGDEEDSSV